jgi:uncharacterized protein YecT (DUF1311 family)
MKSGCVSDSTRAAGRRLAEAYQTALANFGSQARQPSPVPLFERKWFLERVKKLKRFEIYIA